MIISSYNEKDPKIIRARNVARNIPMKDHCEFCGDTPNKMAIGHKLLRHHPDYDEPHIFVTCCTLCHTALRISS